MVDILHRVGIKTPTPQPVYDALATVDGLAGWWTENQGKGTPAPYDQPLGDWR